MKEPVWLLSAVVMAIHGEQIAEHGGLGGLRDEGRLQAALDRPRNLYLHEPASLARLAASYAHGLAKNHAFYDGNKRVSLVCTELFLHLNGYALAADDETVLMRWLALADGSLNEIDLASWLETAVRSLAADDPKA